MCAYINVEACWTRSEIARQNQVFCFLGPRNARKAALAEALKNFLNGLCVHRSSVSIATVERLKGLFGRRIIQDEAIQRV